MQRDNGLDDHLVKRVTGFQKLDSGTIVAW